MRVSCGNCTVKGVACTGCVMGSLLGPGRETADFDQGELAALRVLADAGLIPRLRWAEPSGRRDVTNITHRPRNQLGGEIKVNAIAG